jgi:thiol:disulfide interchange protein
MKNKKIFETDERKAPKQKSRIWSVTALIFAVLSLALCFLPVLSIIFGVLAIGLSIVSRLKIAYFDGVGIAAIIVGIFGVVFAFAVIILKAFIL